jgi:hypothetical protein
MRFSEISAVEGTLRCGSGHDEGRNSVGTARKFSTQLLIIGLAACTVAALAAPAPAQDLRRDGSKAVPFVAEVGRSAGAVASHPVLRRDGSKAVPWVANLEPDVAVPAGDGFDWGDAAVGAGAAIALVALGGAGLALRGRLAPHRPAVRRSKATAT